MGVAVDGIPRPARQALLSSTLTQSISSPAAVSTIQCNLSLVRCSLSDDDPSRRRNDLALAVCDCSTMATLPRRQNGNRLPEYKDYVNFVSAYKNGKKDEEDAVDGQPIVLTINSRIASPETAAINVGKTCESFSEFLGKTKNKKFGPVKPPISSRETINFPKKKTVKTEIFLEINNDSVENGSSRKDAYSVGKTITKFENHNGENKQLTRTQSSGSVEAKKKMFEQSSVKNPAATVPSKVFSPSNSIQGIKIADLQYVLNCPANSAAEGGTPSKVLNSENRKINTDRDETTEGRSRAIPVAPFTKKNDSISSNSHILNGSSSNCRDITKQFLAHETITEDVTAHNQINPNSVDRQIESHPNIDTVGNFVQQLSETKCKEEFPQVRENEITHLVSCSPTTNGVIIPAGPPPPPPMPVYSSETSTKLPKMLCTSIQKENIDKDQHRALQKKISLQAAAPKSANDDQPSSNNRKYSTLERKDPLVRKLAYGAMLDMYGAYHDKANNYVAALPEHQVKKENGLQKIIDNIAAQGGLEKLSGRTNPKAENE